MIKLIISDYDDTLTHGEEVPERIKDAIKKFRTLGGKFAMCTGRTCKDTKRVLDKNEMEVDAVASYVGSHVEVDDKVIWESGVPADIAFKLAREVKEKFNRITMLFFGDTIYSNGMNDYVENYFKWSACNGKYAEDTTEFEKQEKGFSGKIFFVKEQDDKDEDFAKIVDYVHDKFGKYVITFDLVRVVEAISSQATKYQAAKKIAEHFGVKEDEVITMGDAIFDQPLLKFGTGVLVKGGSGENTIKDTAKFFAPSVENMPVAIVLESIMDGTFPKGLEKIEK